MLLDALTPTTCAVHNNRLEVCCRLRCLRTAIDLGRTQSEPLVRRAVGVPLADHIARAASWVRSRVGSVSRSEALRQLLETIH